MQSATSSTHLAVASSCRSATSTGVNWRLSSRHRECRHMLSRLYGAKARGSGFDSSRQSPQIWAAAGGYGARWPPTSTPMVITRPCCVRIAGAPLHNSAAYLLPHLRRPAIARRRLRPGHGHRRSGPPGGPGQVVGMDTSPDVVDEARITRRTGSVATSSSSSATFGMPGSGLASFDVVHAHQVLQHLSDPVGALAAWRPSPGPAAWWRPGTATTRPSPGGHPNPSSTGGWRSTWRWRSATQPNPTPAGGS